MNRWELTKKLKKEYKPIIEEWLNKMKKLTVEEIKNIDQEEFNLELSDTKLNPYTLGLLIEEFGYEENGSDINGYQMDFWYYFINEKENSICQKLCISGCGQIFELNLSITDLCEYYED